MAEYGNWHGTYLTEDEIVADVFAKVVADPKAVDAWLDPQSWVKTGVPPRPGVRAGCCQWVNAGIGFQYGLWHPENPNRTDDIIGAGKRIVKRVLDKLREEAAHPCHREI